MIQVWRRVAVGAVVGVVVLAMVACSDGGDAAVASTAPTTVTVPTTPAPPTTEVTTTESTTTTTTTTLPPTTLPPAPPTTAAPRPGIRLAVKGPSAGAGCATLCYWISGTMTGFPEQEIYFVTGTSMLCSVHAKPGVYFKVCPIEVGTMPGAVFKGELNYPTKTYSNSITIPG